MRRVFGSRHGSRATVALLVVLIATIGLAGLAQVLPTAAVGHRATVAPHLVTPASVRPAANVSVAVTITNPAAAYVLLPYTVDFTTAVTNGNIAPGNAWISVAVADTTPSSGTCVQANTCPVLYNLSATYLITSSGQSSFSYALTEANLTANGPLPSDQFLIIVYVTVNNTASNLTFGSGIERFIVPAAPSGGFAAPLSGGALSTGNVTIAVNYTGSYIGGATVSIYQGSSSAGTLVYSQGVFAPGSGARFVVANTLWYVGVAGTYFAVLNISTPYGSFLSTSTWTVVPAGVTVYQNSSSYQNQTLIPGVSPAVGGTILLVAGLVIGIIVAMALGRMLWGGAKAAPAQPWQAKPATNECSVCHQTFATEAELKDHQKTAHGM